MPNLLVFLLLPKERAWNNLNNDGAGILFVTKPSQEAHSWSTQRLRWFGQEQKDQPECSSYFMHVPKQSLLSHRHEQDLHIARSKRASYDQNRAKPLYLSL